MENPPIPSSNVIDFLGKASQAINLETLTIIPSVNRIIALWAEDDEPATYALKLKLDPLYRVLDKPFFPKLHRVAIDLRDMSINHPGLFLRFKDFIQANSWGTFEGVHTRFSVELRY